MSRGGNVPDSRQWWRQLALQRLKNLEHQQGLHQQLLLDYDTVEEELRALLSIDPTDEPNPTLTAMSHGDLVLLADQWRRRAIGCER